MRRLFLIAPVLLALFRFATSATAEPLEVVAFHGLQTLNVEDATVDELRASVSAAAVILGSREAEMTGEEVLGRCDADVLCHCDAARRRGAENVIFGRVARLSDLYTIELLLVATHDCQVTNSVFVSERLDPVQVSRRVGEVTHELLRPNESVSTSAVKSEREVDDTPAVISVMTREQLRDYGAVRLADAFALVPGYEILETNWGSRVLHQGLPGTTLIVIDGVPILDPTFHFESLGQQLELALDHVERIEFVRGPGSVIWGSSALLGIVNITTRTPKREGTTAEVTSRFGSTGTHELAGRIERAWPRVRVGLSGTLQRAREAPLLVEDSLYSSQEIDPEQQVVWGASGITDGRFDTYYDLGAYLSVANRLELRVQHIAHRNYFEVSPFGSLLEPDAPGRWERMHRLLQLSWNEQLSGATRATVTASRYEVTTEEDFAIHPRHPMGYADGLRALQGNAAEPTVNHLVEARLHHDRRLATMLHRLVIGASFYSQSFPDTYATLLGIDEAPMPAQLDIAGSTFRTLAAFAHDEVELTRALRLSAGLRYEYHTPYASWLGSQAGLLVSTRPIGGKLVFAEGFRPPVANDLLSTVGVEGNPDLRPERSRALMLELEARPRSDVSIKAGASATRIEDIVVLDSDAASPGFAARPVNRGQIDIGALFAEARGRVSDSVSTYVAYSFKTLAETEPNGSGYAVAPHTLAGGATWRPLNDVVGFAAGSLVSGRSVETLVPGTTMSERRDLPPTLRLRAGVRLTNLFDGFDVQATLDNPFRVPTYAPYKISGAVNPLVERRTDSEFSITLRYTP